MARVPTLTGIDRRVLDLLPAGVPTAPGVRAAAVARHLRLPLQEVREILRGLEAVGKAQQTVGWWRRA